MEQSAHPLQQPDLTKRIEHAVSGHLGQPWRVAQFQDLSDLASHPSALLSGHGATVFAKFSRALNAIDQFEAEMLGLKFIFDQSGVSIPSPIGIVSSEDGAALLLEAVEAVERTPQRWRQIGQALARMHLIKGDQFGLHLHGYFGSLYQDNRPVTSSGTDWPTFYAERRLWPRLIGAIDAGHLPIAIARQVETVIARLPHLCGPAIAPALIHGDAQKNNFISAAHGAVVVDPSVHFAHPEIDLAQLDYFEPVPDDVFDGYHDVAPIDPGFAERKPLWRLSTDLAVVMAGGVEYLPRLIESVEPYL